MIRLYTRSGTHPTHHARKLPVRGCSLMRRLCNVPHFTARVFRQVPRFHSSVRSNVRPIRRLHHHSPHRRILCGGKKEGEPVG